jgi:hypothetical protein
MTDTRFALDQINDDRLIEMAEAYDPDTPQLTPGIGEWVTSVRILCWGEVARRNNMNDRSLDDDILFLIDAARSLSEEERRELRSVTGGVAEDAFNRDFAVFHEHLLILINRETEHPTGRN